MRPDGRDNRALRPVRILTGYQEFAEGSAMVEFGKTRVLCAASADDNIPAFRKGTGAGWITAEYALLPRSTTVRTPRESSRGRVGGRTHEIQRIVGRCLRSVVDLEALGEHTIWIDCDVLQADGGTRSASITGAYVALALALRRLREEGYIASDPLRGLVAAVSVGVVADEPRLDLDYKEDSVADVDLNVAMTDDGRFVEIQGTAEGHPFGREQLDELLALARAGIEELQALQREALGK